MKTDPSSVQNSFLPPIANMTTRCKKLVRCNNVCEEHRSYCVDHKKAHEPKRYCEVVLNETHQCSNYARTGETQCASHGEKRFLLTIGAYICGKWDLSLSGYEITPAMRMCVREVLDRVWSEFRVKNADTFHPLSEQFCWKKGRSYMGQIPRISPTYEVRLVKEEAQIPEWENLIPVTVDGKAYKVKVWARG